MYNPPLAETGTSATTLVLGIAAVALLMGLGVFLRARYMRRFDQ
ncbi:LPXTG cell wall anchor domain-containing protein [Streptomyces sp. TRM66268-LWL]|uniref:LPXTG cell wall anchor domain-containing protein n=1 Tax=Streptomyces polyasparticus TaxID=2767826 RepID=A0ABR7SVX5_9ACTN|nr:LPXTG cell wall anchor domain-containing protein [Streptomyces polyasparticus]